MYVFGVLGFTEQLTYAMQTKPHIAGTIVHYVSLRIIIIIIII